jgi:hypothetical protein
MTDPTSEFFEELAQRDHEPLLENTSGTIRFDVTNGKKTDHWFVRIDKGDVTVSHRGGEADASVVGSKAIFDTITSGNASAVAAVLRGTLAVDGDVRLLSLLRRLLPDPPAGKRTAAGAGRSRR